ncbi:MAG: hypothetical protein J6N47_01115 [Lachnospiraceae bacterium]|nr:hypothetical protein [Lachnospiraceae bacterium]
MVTAYYMIQAAETAAEAEKSISSDIAAIPGWAVALFFLVAGVVLCFQGLNLFKIVQFCACAVLAGGTVLQLGKNWDSIWVYVVAAVVAFAAGYAGLRRYKAGLCVTAGVCTYLAVAGCFARSALIMARKAISDIPDTGALVQIWITKIFNHGDISAATGEMSAEYAQPVLDQISEALNVLQTGLVVASLAAVVVSVLVNIFGDVIIIIFTSAAGSFLMAEGVSVLLEPGVEVGIEVFYAIVGAMILIGGTFQFFKKT